MAYFNKVSADIMTRKAINSTGHLGCFYDGCRDRLIDRASIACIEAPRVVSEPPQCKLIYGAIDERHNLLRSIDIQDELRLSLLLNLTHRSGIGAVLDYPYRIDECTRFLYYSWVHHRIKFGNSTLTETIAEQRFFRSDATHIVTSIDYGIDLLVVMQLPSNPYINDKIDSLLEKIADILSKRINHISSLNSAENDLLKYIINTEVYSNMATLDGLDKLSDVINSINFIRCHFTSYRPLSYTLQLITNFFPSCMMATIQYLFPQLVRKVTLFKLLSPHVHNIEQHMLLYRNKLKYIEASLHDIPSQTLYTSHKKLLLEACCQFKQIRNIYRNKTDQLKTLVINARNGENNIFQIDQALYDDKFVFEQCLKKLMDNVVMLNRRDLSIINLRTDEYKSTINDSHHRISEFTKQLSQKEQFPLKSQSQPLVNKHEHYTISSPSLATTFDDSVHSNSRTSLSSQENDPTRNQSQQKVYSPRKYGQSSLLTSSSSSLSLTDTTINIILVGETGVGKSTFINAFANYLTFESLTQAQSSEPVVLMPVSFTMTVGDNFDERTMKFGEVDSLDNEHFNDVGQSVTQHCRSYLFDLHQSDGKKLRLIDTPGFGDTRGLEQDDTNMEHILQYISNLTHLNAICFLLKPNTSRLNMFFRTCLTQLFSFLATTARENIIFCFTNGRSTFYTPGDTAPLLKAILASSSINDISFKKDNTFCFDSESFRYLVALRNGILFSKEEQDEYEKSWSNSVKESNRLIDYINKALRVYHMKKGWQSIKHAQFEITYMIRPILETMRNILRNIILYKNNLLDQLVQLQPKSLPHRAARCRYCKYDSDQIGQFWVTSNFLHEIQTECSMCSCPINQHAVVDYILQYEILTDPSKFDPKGMTQVLETLYQAGAKFAYFLMNIVHSTKDDPFLDGLKDMIKQEKRNCEVENLNRFNSQLLNELSILENRYKKYIENMKPNQNEMELPAIYQLMQTIAAYPVVHEQMKAVKETQQKIMKQYEYEAQKI